MKSTADGLRGRWQFAALVIGVFLLISVLAPAGPAQAISDGLVISQVYGGGGNGGAPYTHDFVELFNRGTTTVSLDGWSIQYASATGTGNFGANPAQITELEGSLAPGHYLLIQEASNANVGAPLPTPDVIDDTPIAMAAGAGKVALVSTTTPLGCNGGSTPCSPEQLAQIVDLVGYGTANFFEGSGGAPTLSATLAAFRSGGGCTETDDNAADFTSGAPAPRNSAAAANLCGGEAAAPLINEFVLNHVGTDTHEYVEIAGDPDTDYSAYTILQIEGDPTGTGLIDSAHTVGVTNAEGYWVTGFLSNAFENGSITLLLVQDFSGAVGNDLDADDDGALDATPWAALVDDVAVSDGGAGDQTYSATVLASGFGGSPFTPGGASRIPDRTDTDAAADWMVNDFDGEGLPDQFAGTPVFGEAYNTPGAANAAVPPEETPVVISQIYGGGGNSGATYTHDFIELYNPGSSAVDISGWSVQYASAAGSTWQVTPLSGSVAPGGYYLIQQAQGSGGTTPLPTPDAIGAIAMSATAGKVALVDSTTALSGACPTGEAIVDFVGFGGSASCFEGSGPAPAPSNTTAVMRLNGGAQDTDDNAADFVAGAPDPRNSGGGGTQLSIDDVSLAEGNAGTTVFAFTVSLSAPAGSDGVTFDIATADGTATTVDNDYVAHVLVAQTIAAGSTTYSFEVLVNGDVAAEPDETFFVNVSNVSGAAVADSQGVGTIVNDDGVTISRIHEIQGSGSEAAAGVFTVEAIVVGDYQDQEPGQLRGFFIQEEDADADANPATSEGIFVFCSSCPVAVAVGDHVRVTGASSEFFGMSQLTASTTASVSVLSSGNPLPSAATVELPVPGVPSGDLAAATAHINAYFEAFEGMLVTFPDTLAVSEYFELARYGQVILHEGGRPHTYTAVNTPTEAGYIDHQIDLASRTVILDDKDNRQNRPIDTPNTPYFYPVPGLSNDNYFRGGDTITNLTGVLHWSFAGQTGTDAWRIRPVTETFSYDFTAANPRPALPEVGGSLTVASFNVLNYFLSIDTVDSCGPTQDQDCRGADSVQELERQRAKLLAALAAIDADVFGFMEMENTPGVEPLADLVAGLPGYAYVDTGVIGTDAIRVGIIYKSGTVQPVGDYAILDSTVDPRFDSSRNRPALAQSFEEIATGARFTVVVNHLKSKGSGCGPGDDDTTTGQGNCNLTRTLAAQAMADWLATDPTGSGDPDVLIIGDLNAYAREDPIVALLNAGYTDLMAHFGGPGAYGYVFDGQLGYLDHALSNGSLTAQVTGAAAWHINADEIPLFDYNDDERTADEQSFEEESDVFPLYEPNPFRASDHDPVIIGLELATPAAPTVDAGGPYSVVEGGAVEVTASGVDPAGGDLTYAWDLDGDELFETPGQTVTFSAAGLTAPATVTISVQATAPGGQTAVDEATVAILYPFSGFLPPVSNPPLINVVNAGRAIPLKFSLGGNRGLDIFAPGYPQVVPIDCSSGLPLGDGEEMTTPGNSGLSYDRRGDSYTIIWKTERGWRNSCAQLVFQFDDGATYVAYFKFN